MGAARPRGHGEAQIAEFWDGRDQAALARAGDLPWWLGDEAFHLAHRSSLLRKDPEWYGPRFGDLPEMGYVWPAEEAPA